MGHKELDMTKHSTALGKYTISKCAGDFLKVYLKLFESLRKTIGTTDWGRIFFILSSSGQY